MGFLDKKERILDIVLTDRGRELLSKNEMHVSYYAFSDDGINYSGSLAALQPDFSNGCALIQSVTSGSAGAGVTTFTASFASAPTPGNMLIAIAGNQGGNQLVTAISQSNVTWTKILSGSDTGSNGTSTSMWYALNIGLGAGTSVVFVNSGGTTQMIVQVAEFAGVLALDQSASNFLDQTYPTGSTGITPATTSQYELVVAGMTSIANNFHSMSSPGYALVGSQTGSAILNTSMFYKLVNTIGTQEAVINFFSPFDPLAFGTAPAGLPVGSIATFSVQASASNKSFGFDDYVHNNLSFEATSKKDKISTLGTFLYTVPAGSKLLPEFAIGTNLSSTLNLERRFYIKSITHTIPNLAEKPVDVVVRATVPVKAKADRVFEYAINQKSTLVLNLFQIGKSGSK